MRRGVGKASSVKQWSKRVHILSIMFLFASLFVPIVTMRALAQEVPGTPEAEAAVVEEGDGDPESQDLPPDADGDGVPDASDNCPATPNGDLLDSDGDGTGDACDETPFPVVDSDGDGAPDADDRTPNGESDADDIPDEADNCPGVSNAGQEDSDGDGMGDACDETPLPVADGDNDGIEDSLDNCPADANGDQADADGDDLGDLCDDIPNGDPIEPEPDPGPIDGDGDGIADETDSCPAIENGDQLDSDGDGTGDACDESPVGELRDTDTDGIADDDDNCPEAANPEQEDTDGDGIGDQCDETLEMEAPGLAAASVASPYDGIEFSVSGTVTTSQNSSTGVGRIGTVTYTYTVVNNSSARFDSRIDIDGEFDFLCSRGSPEPGQTFTCQSVARFDEADWARGYVTSTAILYDNFDSPIDFVARVDTLVNLFDASGIGLEVIGLYVEPSAEYPNGSIEYTYYVFTEQSGLTVAVTDVLRGTQIPDCAEPSSLAVETYACFATYAVTEADAVAGSVRHIARATSLQGPASGNALSVVAIPQRSSLSIEKSVSSPSLATLAYTFDVINTGDATLDGVYVVDDRIPTTAIDCGAGAGIPVTIETGITVSCSAAYTITAADRTAGRVVNSAYATDGETTSDSVTVTYVIQAALAFVKSGTYFNDRPGAFPFGYIAYSFQLTYGGNDRSTLSNITLNDPLLGGNVTCFNTTLPGGGFDSCDLFYGVTEADVARGSVTNSASVTGLERVDSGPVTARQGEDSVTVTIPGGGPPPAPALSIAKDAVAYNGLRIGGGVTTAIAGVVITYEYVVANTGNVDLTNVTVADDRIATSAIDCDTSTSGVQPTIAGLPQGASATCAADYTVTPADAEAGTVTNIAIASDGTTTSPSATETISILLTAVLDSPALTQATCTNGVVTAPTLTLAETPGIVYTANPQPPYAAGQTVIVTATLEEGYAFPSPLPDGWTRTDGPTAALFIAFESVACVEVSPVAPGITEAVCAGGELTLPSLTLASDTEGITYTRTTGDDVPGGAVTVAATLADGYAWPGSLPAGWTEVSPTTATFAVAYDLIECVEVGPVAPTVVQASCAGTRQTVPVVTLPANTEAVVYTRSGTVAVGQTVTITATLQPGYAWPDDTANIAGWDFETASATYTVQLADIKCDLASRIVRILIAILARLR